VWDIGQGDDAGIANDIALWGARGKGGDHSDSLNL